MILETKLLKNQKHQTRVSLLLELVSDAYLTANRTRYMWSITQETTTTLDHASPTTSRSQQLEMIPGFAAQGIHRIHCVVRPRPHLMTGTYPTSVKHRAYTPRAWRAKKFMILYNMRYFG